MITITYSPDKICEKILSLQRSLCSWRPPEWSRLLLFLALFTAIELAALYFVGLVQAIQEVGSSSIVVTEVYYDTPGLDIEEEWVEISNIGNQIIDISRYKIGDEESKGGKEGMLEFPRGTTASPGQVIIIAQEADGFRRLFGRNPDYEIIESDPNVPNMDGYLTWAMGEFALANDGDEILLLDDRNRLVDTMNYGDSSTFFEPGIAKVTTGQSLERAPANCDTDQAADWQSQPYPNPGIVTLGDCPEIILDELLEDKTLPIGQIQGSGGASPFENQLVQFRGIVTGRFEDRNQAGITFYTLFVQDVPGHEDGDPLTSDGIAVFLGTTSPEFKPGDLVQVNGQVTEFFGLTEIDDYGLDITLLASRQAVPEPDNLLSLKNQPDVFSYLESKESMLVSPLGALKVVGPTHAGCGFAVAQDESIDWHPKQSENDADPQGLIMVLHHSDVHCQEFPALATGDLVSAISGPLTYHFDRFKIVNQELASLKVEYNARPMIKPPPRLSTNQFSIATLNLENYFDGVMDTSNSAEPVLNQSELQLKRNKLAHVVSNTLGCPTLLAVQEVENKGLLEALVTEVAKGCGFTYQISHKESADSRGLDLALLSNPQSALPTTVQLRQKCTRIQTGISDPTITCLANQSPLFSRPPLQVEIMIAGQPYTIFVNHFKSKVGGEKETSSERLEQAAHIWEIVNQLLAEDPETRIVVLGDFNDYEQSPTLQQLTAGGLLTNLLQNIPLEERYTYIFDGSAQLIDGILVSPSVLPSVIGAMIFHVNADYPHQMAGELSSSEISFRSSDHDPALIIVNDLPRTKEEETIFVSPTSEFRVPPSQEESIRPALPGNNGLFHWIVWVVIIVGMTIILMLILRRRWN